MKFHIASIRDVKNNIVLVRRLEEMWEFVWYGLLGLMVAGAVGGVRDATLPLNRRIATLVVVGALLAITVAVKVGAFDESPETVALRNDHTPEGLARWIYGKESPPLVVNDGEAIELVGDRKTFLTSGTLRWRAQRDAADYFAKVFPANETIKRVSITQRAPLTDVRGHETMSAVMRVSLGRDAAQRINWPNFDPTNLPAIADSYWEHPAFSD